MKNQSFKFILAINSKKRAFATFVALIVMVGSQYALAQPWPANPNWQAFNMVPTGSSSCPVRVYLVEGNVTNAQRILCNSGGGLTLTMTAGGATPRVVLDYGKDVGGIPWFDVSATTGNPKMKVGYSESLDYRTDNGGDFPPFQGFGNGEGDLNRADIYTVSAPGFITNRYTQGGERFQTITLTSPGSVTLRGAGINYIADRTQAANYGGYFLTNDDALNRVWYSSAYTAQLNAVPTRSLPGSYQIENGTLSAWGSNTTGGSDIGFYTLGTGWTDYTMAFDANIVNQQAGWVVRSRDSQNGLVFLLKGNTLHAFTAIGNKYTQIASVATPFVITPGTWYSISTSLSGSTATVKINGTQTMSVTSNVFSSGSVGFRQWGPEEARFRNLVVKNSAGATLLNLPFNNASQLTGFRIPGSNEVPSLLDGAKRDRLVWSGDLDTAGPTMSYTVGNNDYLKGSLQLFATRQHTSGFIEGVIPATYPLINATNLTSEVGAYSATYSMYFVLGLYDHLMYSGDRAFSSSMWSAVQRQLAWNATRLDSRGLFITRNGDGADWDFYDAEKVGAITAYNVIYYRTLMAAAAIGDAIGQSSAAVGYRMRADSLRNAINAYMYDGARGVYKISDTVPAIAQDANVLAVLAGVPPAAEVPRILASIKAALWTTPYGPMPFNNSTVWAPIISTFISGYEAQARYLVNDSENAEQLIRTVFGRLANPLNFQYTGTMWENVKADGTPGLDQVVMQRDGIKGPGKTSLAHAWATGSVTALSGYVLGIRPTAPGFDTWIVQPHPGTLAWAVGRAPTPHGALSVKWGGVRGSSFSMEVVAPKDTSGVISIPTFGVANPTITVNGNAVWRNGTFATNVAASGASTDGKFINLNGIQSGTYTIEVTPG